MPHRPRNWPTVALALVLVPLLVACEDHTRRGVRDPLGGPTPIPDPEPLPTTIAYRVTGTIANVRITYVNSSQGTTEVTSDLPWFVTVTTREPSTFTYLAAEAPLDNLIEGSLVVQIFVNGQLFRESRASGFNPSVSVSGEVTR